MKRIASALAIAAPLPLLSTTAAFLPTPYGQDDCKVHYKRRQPGLCPQIECCQPLTPRNVLFAVPSQKSGEEDPKNDQPEKKKKKNRPNVRMKVFQFLNLPSVEVLSVLAVLLSSFLVALDTLTLPSLGLLGISSDPHIIIIRTLDVINVVFAVDFFIRWYAAGNFKPIYLLKPLVQLDILCVLLPLFLATVMPFVDGYTPASTSAFTFDSAGLQNLLLLRILRLRRVLTDITTFTRFQVALGLKPKDVRPYQLQLARVLLSVFTLLSVASGLIYTTEHGVNPDIPNYFAALYFGLTTLTTVGFGDIAPVTSGGRLVVGVSILAGVAVFPAQLASLVDALIAYQDDAKKGGPRVTIRPAAVPVSEERGTARSVVHDDGYKSRLSEIAIEHEEEDAGEDDDKATNEDPFIGWLGRCCLNCEATEHREDASYCWSCGSKL